MRRGEARRQAQMELEELTDKVRWGIQEVLKETLDQLHKEGKRKELLFVRATRNALRAELRVARFAEFFDSGYRAYIRHLTRLPDPQDP